MSLRDLISGKYHGQKGTVKANVYQKTADHPDEWANGYHVMLDTDEQVTVRWQQVEGSGFPRQCVMVSEHIFWKFRWPTGRALL